MNISAPPNSSRKQNTASRTSSLTTTSSKIAPFSTLDSRTNSAKSFHVLSETYQATNSSPIKSLKASSIPRNSSSSLLRFSSNDNSKNRPGEVGSGNDRGSSTPKARTPRSQSLTTESSKKLNEFISSVRQQQLNQQLSPSHDNSFSNAKLGAISKNSSTTNMARNLKHLNSGTLLNDTPTGSDKKRLVKQFYQDNKTSKGTTTPQRNGSLTSEDLGSPITPDIITANVFDNFKLDDKDDLDTSKVEDQKNYNNSSVSNPYAEGDHMSIDKELMKLKQDILQEVKAKVFQTEVNTTHIFNSIQSKRAELVESNKLILSRYEDLKKELSLISQRDFSKYSLSNENGAFDKNLNELDTNLNKYRDIINKEKSLIAEIDDDLEYLEKLTLQKIVEAKQNRNRIAIVISVAAVIYTFYFLRS